VLFAVVGMFFSVLSAGGIADFWRDEGILFVGFLAVVFSGLTLAGVSMLTALGAALAKKYPWSPPENVFNETGAAAAGVASAVAPPRVSLFRQIPRTAWLAIAIAAVVAAVLTTVRPIHESGVIQLTSPGFVINVPTSLKPPPKSPTVFDPRFYVSYGAPLSLSSAAVQKFGLVDGAWTVSGFIIGRKLWLISAAPATTEEIASMSTSVDENGVVQIPYRDPPSCTQPDSRQPSDPVFQGNSGTSYRIRSEDAEKFRLTSGTWHLRGFVVDSTLSLTSAAKLPVERLNDERIHVDPTDVTVPIPPKVVQNPPEMGALSLKTKPEAEVFWNGTSLGKTPLIQVPTPVGTQLLTLKGPDGKVHNLSAKIEKDRTAAMKYALDE
jgi:hypothetical protein